MSSPALPLTPIVDVTVIAGPALASPPTFNQGLIIGPSAIIPHATRLVQFTSLTSILTYGFSNTAPEYLAAELYFGQPEPPVYLWIGLQDTTSLKTIIPHSGNAGTGYAVGDTIVVVQSGASGGTATVSTIGGSGAVTGLIVSTVLDGTGYSVATGLTTTTSGAGTGLEVDITAVGETAVTSVENCRAANSIWYSCMVTDAVTADHEAIAAYTQGATPPTFYYGGTSDAAVLNNSSGNLAATLKSDAYSNIAIIYSTTQGGAAPQNAYAAAALMGSVMGQNTGLPNSYFTEWGKVLTGVMAEPLTSFQVTTITGNNCNVYVGYVNVYTIVQPGITPSGLYIDQVLNRAILAANIQYAVMNLLISSPAVPQTDPGETQLIHAVNNACAAAVTLGYLAPGVYQGVNSILGLDPGDPLPAGYLSQAYPYSTQSQSAHAARQAMPIYTVVNEAGAVQSVTIGVIVNL
jgi:Protein of unknown function (DUF3383)